MDITGSALVFDSACAEKIVVNLRQLPGLWLNCCVKS